MNETEHVYSKIVVAKHSPENGCYAKEGQILFVKPRLRVPHRTVVQHHFVCASDEKTKCKFGWIKEVPAFTLVDFINRHIGHRTLTPAEGEHILTMLESLTSLAADTPVGCDYKSRGVIEQSMQLTVHKVFFYSA